MSIIKQRGINLIEVLITIAITTVGLLGISSLQLQSNRATQDSGNKTQAVWILEDLSNRMNANSRGLASYATTGNYVCPANAPTMCADHNTGSSKVAVAACSVQQVAIFDLWDVICPHDNQINGIDIRKSASDFISNPRLSITVNDAQQSALLSITWDVRTSGRTATGNTAYIADDSVTNRTATLIREVRL